MCLYKLHEHIGTRRLVGRPDVKTTLPIMRLCIYQVVVKPGIRRFDALLLATPFNLLGETIVPTTSVPPGMGARIHWEHT